MKINVKDVALATAIILAVGACGYTVYNEAFGNKIVKSSRGSACASSSIGSSVSPDLNPSDIVDDIIEPREDEEEDKDDQTEQDDSQNDNKTKKDAPNLPVIDGEKGSAELPGANGFVVSSDLYGSVFKSMPIYVGGNPEFNYDRGKEGMIKNIEKYKNTAALKVNTGTGGAYTMVYYRDGSQSVLERKDINVFNDPNWDL